MFIWMLPLIAFATAYLLSEREDVAAWSGAALAVFALVTIDGLVYPHNENTLYLGGTVAYLDTVRAASTVLRVPPELCSVITFNRPDRGALGAVAR